jgi:hypothetical protein
MRDLYDQLLAAGEAGIAQLVSERRQENVSLEFKTKANPTAGEPTREDRQNLAIALSAFSNSMGGLIVWGISANKDAEGVDCATGLQPIASIERFKADATRLVSQALMPRHEGILVEAIPTVQPPGAGYLAIYVERSERRPHRAELGVGRYFKRIGDSSIAMEHYDIEDSFKRLVVPWLEVEWLIMPGMQRGGPDGNFRQVVINIHLRNPSPVTARFPFLTISRVEGAIVRQAALFSRHRTGEAYTFYNGEHHFVGAADDVIHPGLMMPIAQIVTSEIPVEQRGSRDWYVRPGSLRPVKVAYQCGCYNARPAAGEFVVSDVDLVKHGIVGGFIY